MSRPADRAAGGGSTSGAPAAGVIHDIGYQRYRGPRLGRGYAFRSLFVHSLRTAFGLGRSAKAKLLPTTLFGGACIAALVLVIVATQTGLEVVSPVRLVGVLSYGAVAFVAVVAPELVSRDLRNSLLPLYFSRPLTRTDYALAKLAALSTAVFALLAGPVLVMFVGMSLGTNAGFSGVMDQAGKFLLGVSAALIHAVVLAALALPLASLSGRRVFASGMIVALFLITAPISNVLAQLGSGGITQIAGMFDPVNLLGGVDKWMYGEGSVSVGPWGPMYGVATLVLTGLATSLLVWRFRKVQS